MTSENSIYKAKILRRAEITFYDSDGVPIPTIEIMYSTQFLGPSIIRIPIRDYSAEVESKKIREDIDDRLKRKPEFKTV